jgi:DNA-binding response OmpR family regulator
MSEKIRVILTEDDGLLRDSLENLLEISGFAVWAAPDALSFFRALAEHQSFDVAIIDLGLPDEAGEVLVEFLRQRTTTAIIVVTARDTIDTRINCYRTGADLFLGKPVDGRELVAAISSLAARRRTDPPSVNNPPWKLTPLTRKLICPNGKCIDLSVKESKLLEVLLSSPGKAIPRSMLLDTIYQRNDVSADRALDQLVRRTRRAISTATGLPAPLLTEHGVGYAFIEPATIV